MFADLFDVVMIVYVFAAVLIGRLEDPSEGCNHQGSFSDDMTCLVGHSSGFRQDLISTYLRD